MREKSRPKPRKACYYVNDPLIREFFTFTRESPSEEMPAAMLLWMALDSLSHEDRRAIQEIAGNYSENDQTARKKVLAIVRRGVVDGILLESARTLSPQETRKVLRAAR